MSLRSWLFGTDPGPIDLRSMNEDWQRGDLAECIFDDWIFRIPDSPQVGDILRVSEVCEGVSFGARIYTLSFEGKDPRQGWATQCFRKIRPVHEPAEASFVASIRRRGRVDA